MSNEPDLPPPGTAAATAAAHEPTHEKEAPAAPSFTKQDAQTILAIVQRAPLQNLSEAEVLHGAILRFADFVNGSGLP